MEWTNRVQQLLQTIETYRSCAVAFSGGVDSALVAKAAQLALGSRAIAVTAVSPSLAAGELEEASEVARQIGIRHEILRTNELENPAYAENSPRRCYFCKSELYQQLTEARKLWNVDVIANGTNRDDLGDYRPGLLAAEEAHVRSPLAECEFDKQDVRRLAEQWQLPVWNKPAMPCLSSRIAYGEEVTAERLRMIDQAEQYLRSIGFRELRVRYHRGDLARIEVPANEIGQLMSADVRTDLEQRFRQFGFRFVTIDLAGLQSGSLNVLIPEQALHRS